MNGMDGSKMNSSSFHVSFILLILYNPFIPLSVHPRAIVDRRWPPKASQTASRPPRQPRGRVRRGPHSGAEWLEAYGFMRVSAPPALPHGEAACGSTIHSFNFVYPIYLHLIRVACRAAHRVPFLTPQEGNEQQFTFTLLMFRSESI